MKPIAVRMLRTTLGLLALAAASAASAQAMVTARVLSSTPAWEPVPVSSCAPGQYGGRPSGAGSAVGAVLGGLIGSQFGGGGGGHAAGAVLGALGGAMLGNTAEAQQRGYYGGGGCATRYENRVNGYDVSYEWNGQRYQVRMPQDPGAWVQVPAPNGYSGGTYGAYGAPGVPSYPVAPPPMSGSYPLPGPYGNPYPAAGEMVSAPMVSAPGYGYGYPAPVYGAPAPYPGTVYAPAPMVVGPAPVIRAPVSVGLSIGGMLGGGHRWSGPRGGWNVGIGF